MLRNFLSQIVQEKHMCESLGKMDLSPSKAWIKNVGAGTTKKPKMKMSHNSKVLVETTTATDDAITSSQCDYKAHVCDSTSKDGNVPVSALAMYVCPVCSEADKELDTDELGPANSTTVEHIDKINVQAIHKSNHPRKSLEITGISELSLLSTYSQCERESTTLDEWTLIQSYQRPKKTSDFKQAVYMREEDINTLIKHGYISFVHGKLHFNLK